MNKKIKILRIDTLIFSPLFLTSCASVSDIVPAGNDKYLVSGSDLSIGASGSKIKTDLYKKASVFCASKNMDFEPVDDSSVDYRSFCGTANAELIFSCVQKKAK